MLTAAEVSRIIAAGDDLADSLNVLLATHYVEGRADMLGLETNAQLSAWEAATALFPRAAEDAPTPRVTPR